MYKITTIISVLLMVFIGMTSCRKCMECSYSYTTTYTEFTPNGEVTKTDTVSNETLDDENGFPYFQVCGSAEDREKMEEAYKNAENDLNVNNYSYRCFDY